MDSQTLDHISRGNVSAVSSFLSQLGTKKRSAASILSTVIDNTTALHAAVCAPRGSSVELVSMLLSAGAPADTREPCESRTALHIALARGELRAAALLLQGGGSLEAKDKQGLTPVDLVSALLSKGMWEAGGGARALPGGSGATTSWVRRAWGSLSAALRVWRSSLRPSDTSPPPRCTPWP